MPNPDRSTYIGTTDVASLFGLSPYPDRTYLRLWREKAGLVDREDLSGRDDIEFGKRMEDLVCGWVCEREGWERLPKQFLGNYHTEGLAGENDGFIRAPGKDGLGNLEGKTVHWDKFKRWNGEMPIHYQLQVQCAMGLAGIKWGVFAIYVLGSYKPETVFEYKFEPKAFEAIRREAAKFWQSIKDGKEPDATDEDKMQPFIRKLLTDEVVDLSGNNELASLVQKYRELEQQHQNARFKVSTLDQPKYHAFYDVQKYLADNKITAKRIKVGDAELITTITKEVPVKAFVRPAKQSFKIKYQHEGVNENE